MSILQQVRDVLRQVIPNEDGSGYYTWMNFNKEFRLAEVATEQGARMIQQCYLECVAVGCGECARAIATKYPDFVSRVQEEEAGERTDESVIEISTVKPNQSWTLSMDILVELMKTLTAEEEATLHLNNDFSDLSITFKRGI